MIEFIQNFHFLRPWILLFLLLPIGFYLKKIGMQNTLSSWENICDKNLLKYLLVANGSQKRISLKKYIYTGMIVAIFAAAGPAWKKIEIPTLVVENPTMFLLCLSNDMQLTDITPSRLERSKFAISDIADIVSTGQFGLEVYSKEPYIITPLSDDIKIIKNLLPQITPNIVPDQGNRLDRAIDLALSRFKSSGYTNGNIVVFASDVGQRLDLALNKVQEASKMNYNVHIVDTSFKENDKMKMLAEKGNGLYLNIKNPQLQKLAERLESKDEQKTKLSENMRSNFLDYGYYLIFIPLLCLLPFFRRGLLIFILLIGFTTQAHAGFLLNQNQEAFRLFNNQQYEMALKKFKDSLWKGITLYKMDKKEEALKELSNLKTDVSYYNSGVILTKLCNYEDALKAFEEALKLNPNNEDAQYNKQVLVDLFEKAKEDSSVLNCNDEQQQQNQQNQNNNSNDENQNQDNQSSDEQQNEQNNDEQQENSSDEQQDQQEQNGNQNDDKQDNNSDEQQNEQKQDLGQQNQNNENQSNNNSNKDDSKKDNSNDSAPKDDSQPQNEQNQENKDTPSQANSDNGNEQNSKNEKGDEDNATDMQEEEVETQLMNAKQGDENTKYDEEALAMQRRYREIPEDPGGLLREFIKKEYMKDRYHDENM